ncbi:MAG TPA: peptide chain release factor 2 [Candidatus Saccharimonadales bacterium]|nr:peptide chain release factor 2 [Candidatus Saccharimonadales bacterium]
MGPLSQRIQELAAKVAQGVQQAKVSDLEAQAIELTNQIAAPDFWQDNQHAQEVTKQHAKLVAHIEPWRTLEHGLNDLRELAEMNDTEMLKEMAIQLDELEKTYAQLEFSLRFSGPYDAHDAILRLYAGAGGTDAQDWTEMLQRMYLRWAEAHDMKAEVIDQSAGEEAGLKSATIMISGPHAYGKLKGEHGVHRLVRLSPFNADHLRQTSFAMVEVLPQIDEPKDVELSPDDLRIDVYRSGGNGGQSVNTTDSAVRITHVPTGIVVAIQNERSQLQNRETAMKVLRSKLAQLQVEQHKERIDDLKGPNQSAEWGNQIRNYVLHPYTLVKDTRTKHEEHDAQAVLDGAIDPFISAYLQK